jgi:D-arabinose 5-phosphate isomerase GutQ
MCTWTSAVPEEACPLGLAPTASTTAALVMGDALAIALLEARGFTSDDFAARIRPAAARPTPAGAHQRRHAPWATRFRGSSPPPA